MEVQGVHKVSMQIRKFITKANERTDEWKLLQNETYVLWDGQILGKGPELSPVPDNCNQMSQVAYCRES